jgi:hypothetical protein
MTKVFKNSFFILFFGVFLFFGNSVSSAGLEITSFSVSPDSAAYNEPINFSWTTLNYTDSTECEIKKFVIGRDWVSVVKNLSPNSSFSMSMPIHDVLYSINFRLTCVDKQDNDTKFAYARVYLNGKCGSLDGQNVPYPASYYGDLCSSGGGSLITCSNGHTIDYDDVIGKTYNCPGPWTWTCYGSDGGSIDYCSANEKIDGKCVLDNPGFFRLLQPIYVAREYHRLFLLMFG